MGFQTVGVGTERSLPGWGSRQQVYIQREADQDGVPDSRQREAYQDGVLDGRRRYREKLTRMGFQTTDRQKLTRMGFQTVGVHTERTLPGWGSRQ